MLLEEISIGREKVQERGEKEESDRGVEGGGGGLEGDFSVRRADKQQ